MLASLAATVLGGCASQETLHETQLAQLLSWLPGNYDNTAQVQQDVREGVQPAHDALALSIVEVDDPVIGEHVYYVQEMAAGDARRVMAQNIWTFEASKQGMTQHVWTLAEPLRWRDGQRDPDLLRGMMNQDLSQVQGCDLSWKKRDDGFAAANDPHTCHKVSRATSGTVHNDLRLELDANGLAIADNATDAAGRLVQGRTDLPFSRFRRTAP